VKFRRLPNTDLSISEIGFGCGGNAGLMVRGSAEKQASVIARAIELGINYFDNAPDYGDGLAEENLGRALKALKLKPVITTKVEIRAEDLGDVAGHVVRSTEASLKRLGIDCVDVLQIHNGPTATPPSLPGRVYHSLWLEDFLRPGGAIEGLHQLVRDGKARYVGFICRGNDGDEVRALLDTGVFRLINVPYSLLNPSAGMAKPPGLKERDYGGVINDASARGVGAAIYSPLAGGALTDDNIRGLGPHPLARPRGTSDSAARNRERAARLRFLVDAGNAGRLAQAATAFILMHPGVTTVLGGFSDETQLEEIASVSGADPLSPAAMARLDKLWRDDFTDSASG
jgi:aryl-alcohol dehydrogenase-like predicted oxidoreductase